MSWIAFCLAICIALIHLIAKSKLVRRAMEAGWITSGSGGVTMAYVFIHLMPELSEHQTVLEKQKESVSFLQYFEHYAYVVALLGLILYFGIERYAGNSKQKRTKEQGSSLGVFWLHIGSFVLFNSIVGYLLVHRMHTNTPANLLLYGIAMALHFLIVDHALSNHHERKYDHFGRWLLSAAVILGWASGKWCPIPEAALALLFAFLSGATLINVMKEELPIERRNHFWSFVLGALVYTVLLQFSH